MQDILKSLKSYNRTKTTLTSKSYNRTKTLTSKGKNNMKKSKSKSPNKDYSRKKTNVTSKSKKGDFNESDDLDKPKHYTAHLKKDLIFKKEFLMKEHNDLTNQLNKSIEGLNILKRNYLKINVFISFSHNILYHLGHK